MRDYAMLVPTFWTGETGRNIRARGRDAQVMAIYLMSAPSSNMIGLYYAPFTTICHETGMSAEGASKALRSLSEVGFAHYDAGEEVVWVPEMARYQIGASLKATDNRVKGVAREALQYRKCRYFNAFCDRYKSPYNLDTHLKGQARPQGPCKPLRSQEQDQEQDQEVKSAGADLPANAGVPTEPGKKPRARKHPTGEHQALIDFFCESWRARYGVKYEFRGGREGRHVQWILNALVHDLPCAKRIVADYLRDEDPWVVRKRHPLGLLVSQFNQYRVPGEAPPRAAQGFASKGAQSQRERIKQLVNSESNGAA